MQSFLRRSGSALTLSALIAHTLFVPLLLAFPLPSLAETRESETGADLFFTENTGRWHRDVQFAALQQHWSLFVTNDHLRYSVTTDDGPYAFDETLLIPNHTQAIGANPISTEISFYNPTTNTVDTSNSYQSLLFSNVWSGIDLELIGRNNTFEKIFTVAPNISPHTIALQFNAIRSLSIAPDGSLQLTLPTGTTSFSAPIAYQFINGQQHAVDVSYRLIGNTAYGFTLGTYNTNYPLIIDPIYSSTYLGGSGVDTPMEIAYDSSGNVFVVGTTDSVNFPIESGYQSTRAGNGDIYIAKLSSNLSTLLASTYLGGSSGGGGYDSGVAIAIDSNDDIFVCGYGSTSFPMVGSGYDQTHNGQSEIVIAKLNNALSSLSVSTYLGGSNHDHCYDIEFDSNDNLFVAGYTFSTDYPTLNGYDTTFGFQYDVFVTKLSNDLATMSASTYLGGAGGGGERGTSIAIDSNNNVYIVGDTDRNDFPIVNGYDSTRSGNDAFIAKFTNNLATLSASTFLGGNGSDVIWGVYIDSNDNVYVSGGTGSSNFPTTANAYEASQKNSFVSKFNSDLDTLLASTYYGGSGNETIYDVVVDSAGNAYITGRTSSSDLPLDDAYDSSISGPYDSFIAQFSTDMQHLIASTYMGGTGEERGQSMAIDDDDNVCLVGQTFSSSGFPTDNGYDTTFNGGAHDSFITCFDTIADGRFVKALPTNVDAVLATNTAVNVTRDSQTGTQAILLQHEEKSVSELCIDFDATDKSFKIDDWTLERDDSNFRSIVHRIGNDRAVCTGLSNYTLYVKKAPHHDKLRVCSGKLSIGCTVADSWSFLANDAGNIIQTNGGFDTTGVTVNVISLDGEQVWEVTNLSGTSGQGEADVPDIRWWALSMLVILCMYLLHREGLMGGITMR